MARAYSNVSCLVVFLLVHPPLARSQTGKKKHEPVRQPRRKVRHTDIIFFVMRFWVLPQHAPIGRMFSAAASANAARALAPLPPQPASQDAQGKEEHTGWEQGEGAEPYHAHTVVWVVWVRGAHRNPHAHRHPLPPTRPPTNPQGLQLKRHIDATLGQGNILEAVRLPPGEDLKEWLAVNTVGRGDQGAGRRAWRWGLAPLRRRAGNGSSRRPLGMHAAARSWRPSGARPPC